MSLISELKADLQNTSQNLLGVLGEPNWAQTEADFVVRIQHLCTALVALAPVAEAVATDTGHPEVAAGIVLADTIATNAGILADTTQDAATRASSLATVVNDVQDLHSGGITAATQAIAPAAQ